MPEHNMHYSLASPQNASCSKLYLVSYEFSMNASCTSSTDRPSDMCATISDKWGFCVLTEAVRMYYILRQSQTVNSCSDSRVFKESSLLASSVVQTLCFCLMTWVQISTVRCLGNKIVCFLNDLHCLTLPAVQERVRSEKKTWSPSDKMCLSRHWHLDPNINRQHWAKYAYSLAICNLICCNLVCI